MDNYNSNKKKDYIWNTAAGIINASEAVIISLVVTRVTGVNDAGIFTIAFALSNLFLTLGKFGIRTFQVTDVNGQYSLGTYMITRIITTLGMLIVSVGYLIFAIKFRDYSYYKATIILSICSLYSVESLEDVLAGFLQNQGYLYKGAKMFCFRWCVILGTFITLLLWTKNAIMSLGLALLASVVTFVFTSRFIFWDVARGHNYSCSIQSIHSLMRTTFPLFGSLFFTYYINNSVKYAIDGVLSDQIQAYYGYISMPVFVTSLFTSFIFQPHIVLIAKKWSDGDIVGIKQIIKKSFVVIIVISTLIVSIASVIGTKVLSWFYGVNLYEYRLVLLIIMITSGIIAGINFESIIVNVLRIQEKQFYGTITASIILFSGLPIIVRIFGIYGGTIAYMLTSLVLFLYLCIVIVARIDNK